MENLIESGIYEILNLTTKKVYVGHSTYIRQRWHLHKRDLRKNKHHNAHLQHAWNKYGEDDFIFRKLELVEPNKEKLIERELHWCTLKNCNNSEFGYNIEIPGDKRKYHSKEKSNQRKSAEKYTVEYYMSHSKLKDKNFTQEELKYIGEQIVELRKTHSQVNIEVSQNFNNVKVRIPTSTGGLVVDILIKDKTAVSHYVGQPIVQVDIFSGKILKTFNGRIEVREELNMKEKKLSNYLEYNNFQARSQKRSRLLHPYNDTIIMYEKYYRPDFDYKSAVKVGELIEVSRGSSKEVLTRYEFQNLLGREVNDYMWPKLRSISYNQSKVDYEGFTLVFLRKSVRDESKVLKTISGDIKEYIKGDREIVAIKEGEIIKTYSNSKEMTADLGIDHKHTSRLLAKSNGKKGKKKRHGFLYYYKDQINS